MTRYWLTLFALALLAIPASSFGTVSASVGCQFLTAPGVTPAFCEDLSGGAAAGGRAGDLDESRWSVARNVANPTSTYLMSFPQVPVGPCKASVTQANPDNDLMVCDAASGHQGQFEQAMKAQNYAMFSLRPRQAFDFAGRTGTIAYNVDAITQGEGSWWTSLYVTDDPVSDAINSSEVMGLLPNNGLGLNFNDQCSQTNASQTKLDNVYTYANTVESIVPLSGTSCFTTSRGHLNHIEVQLSQTSIAVWASDFSPDGVTFPNFRQVGSAALNLPFTRGYVHFQQNERAPLKNEPGFYNPGYANNYWSGLGFDGPVVGQETAFMAPDSLTVNPNPVGDAGGATGALNVGYAAPATLSIPNVNSAGAMTAKLTFTMTYVYAFNLSPTSVMLHYSLNSGPVQTPPQPNYAAEVLCTGCPGSPIGGGGVLYSIAVPVAALLSGTNTVAITVDNQNNGYPPVIGNMDLLLFGGAVATPVPTPVPPTSTPMPTATPGPDTCTTILNLNGTPTAYARPMSDCADQ